MTRHYESISLSSLNHRSAEVEERDCFSSVILDRINQFSERGFREMIDALPVAIYTVDAEGRLTHFNPACVELSGRKPDPNCDRWCVTWKLYYPDGAPMPHDECPMAITIKEGQVVRGAEAIAERPDGTRIWFQPYPTALRDAEGRIIGGINMLVDITERKQSEARIQSEAEALCKLNELSSRLWTMRSLREGLDEMLAATIDLLGADFGNIQLLDEHRGTLTIEAQCGFNQDFLDFFHEVSAKDDSACGRALRLSERIIVEDIEADVLFAPIRHVCRKAGFRSVQSTPLLRRGGRPLGVISTYFRAVHHPSEQELRRLDLYARQASDFIERCRTEEALRENDQRKDEFLAMLSHELRNPLAPIRSAAHALKLTGPTDANQQWACDIIERQTQHLTRLVDDLLDVSRITQGKITLQREPLELSTIINRAVEASRPLVGARGHHLTITLPPEPMRVAGDLTRLVQVVSNLLNNAAKYTDEGGYIHIEAWMEGAEAVVCVRDNGMGMPADLLPHVFDLFAQADRSFDRSQGGLGIGLTLVRRLVEMHGGRVQARSEGPGRGSEFILRLPLAPVQGSGSEARRTEDSSLTRHPTLTPLCSSRVERTEVSTPNAGGETPLRVLLIEDNVDSAEMMGFVLKLGGHETRLAYNGSTALDAARVFQPQVIVCDLGLPGMDGYEVAKQLRAQPEFKQARLIAISGYARYEDRSRAKDAGFDYHLTKPVEPDALTALLDSLRPDAVKC